MSAEVKKIGGKWHIFLDETPGPRLSMECADCGGRRIKFNPPRKRLTKSKHRRKS